MHDYIELAHRTSADPADAISRLKNTYNLHRSLFGFLAACIATGKAGDHLKRAIFYGTPFDANKMDAEFSGGLQSAIEIMARVELLNTRFEDPRMVELLHAALGIYTEACELIEALITAGQIDEVNLREEAGDICWYLAKLMKFTGTNFEEVMERNIAKLRARYPEKYTDESAVNRDLDAERAILAGRAVEAEG